MDRLGGVPRGTNMRRNRGKNQKVFILVIQTLN